jgi:1-aminocyclopropane-1-carboxylate deaminase
LISVSEQFPLASDAPLQALCLPILQMRGIDVKVLRLDLLHPHMGGNKYFKLYWNLQQAIRQQHRILLSFGGAWSNHIRALAFAAAAANLKSIGVIRGELVEPLNPVLRFARDQGMHLHCVDRTRYRRKTAPEFIAELKQRFGDFYLIPEGGNNREGRLGAQEIAGLLTWKQGQGSPVRRFVLLACGTGATLAGLLQGMAKQRLQAEIVGIAVLKNADFLIGRVQHYLREDAATALPKWHIELGFHGGGYAKCSASLQNFINKTRQETGLPLEPVYSGKLFFSLLKMVEQGSIPPGSEVIVIHSGGVHPAAKHQ